MQRVSGVACAIDTTMRSPDLIRLTASSASTRREPSCARQSRSLSVSELWEVVGADAIAQVSFLRSWKEESTQFAHRANAKDIAREAASGVPYCVMRSRIFEAISWKT